MPASPRFRLVAFLACLWLAGSAAPAARAQVVLLTEASAAYDEGRYEDALLALDKLPATAEARYLRARVLAELDRHGEALDTLGEPPASWPDKVKKDLVDLRTRWAAEAGRCGQLELLAAGDNREAKRLLARCLFSARDYARARPLLESEDDVASRGMLVRTLVALGERQAALPLARTLYVEHAGHREASFCGELLRGDKKKLTLEVEEHLTRAEALIKARRPEAAHEELKGLDKRTPRKLRARLWHVRGEALFRTRHDYDDAEKAYAKAASYGGDTEAHDAFHAVRSASRAGKDRAAIQRYRAFAKKYPKSSLAPDALYLAGWLSAQAQRGDAREALKRFVQSDAGKKAPGLRRDALWDLAWLALERGDAHDAKRWLEECAAVAKDPMQSARVAYWQGRAALLRRERDEARQHFKATLELDRLGYYAQLAARRLMALGDPAPSAFPAAPTTQFGALPVLTPPPEVNFYRALGLWSEAAAAGNAWIQAQADRPTQVAALLSAGDLAEAHRTAAPLMQDVLSTPPDGPGRWLWSALFPRPYATSVDASTSQYQLPTALFYGHMQVESRYRPRAVSGADALGLMQLLPSTAAKVAERLDIPSDRASLMRPYVNVALGARYLASLVTQYRGQYPLAIAAYNAGTQRVDNWLAGEGQVELDRWVERISVEQTRNYVRRVISAFSRYHAMEAPQTPWDLPLPEYVSANPK